MNLELEYEKYMHDTNQNWCLDKEEEEFKISQITREFNSTDIFNNPCIYLVNSCNGNCKYCYQDKNLRNDNSLTIEDVKEFIDILEPFQDDKTNRTIELFGGEPLLHRDIVNIIELLTSYNYKILIATNGTSNLLRDADFLKKLNKNVHVRISLDGHTKELHEKYRTFNSFDKIVENIKIIRANHIDMSVKTIINDYNFPFIEDILKYVKYELGVKYWNYNVLYQLDAFLENDIKSSVNHLDMVKELTKDKYYEYLPMMKQTPFCQMLTNVYVKHLKRYRRNYIFLNYDKKSI